MDNINNITTLGETNFRNRRVRFGIKTDDRRRHIYVIGKTGSGKTTLLENMMIEDIAAGKGVGLIDPHGEFAEKILSFIPKERIDDVVYFNPSDVNRPIAFNPLERVGEEHRHLVASGIMSVFKKIWVDAWSARMEYILNNALLALLEYPDSTLLEILRLFSDKEYRKKIVDGLQDPVIKGFWINEFGKYTQRLETESLASIQNKVGQFVSNPLIRNIIGQPKSTINMRKIMDEKKILIVNLSKGRIGEDNSALLGAMIITRLQLAAMSRVDVPEEKRQDFFMSVDEFQNFATASFANILSEARKYRLSLTLAHQYVDQLDDEVRSAVFGNVGTIVSFRVGATDAEFLEKEFLPEFSANDLVNLPKANIYLRLMIDGMASRPFSAITIKPDPPAENNFAAEIIEQSQNKFGLDRKEVEEAIAKEWLGSEATTNIDTTKSDRGDRPRTGDYRANRRPPVRENNFEKPVYNKPRQTEKSLADTLGQNKLPVYKKEEKRVKIERPQVKVNMGDLRQALEKALAGQVDGSGEDEAE